MRISPIFLLVGSVTAGHLFTSPLWALPSGVAPLAGKTSAFSMDVEVTPGVSLGGISGVNPDFSKEVEVQPSTAAVQAGDKPSAVSAPPSPQAPVVLSSPVIGLKVPLQVSLGEEKKSSSANVVDFSGLVSRPGSQAGQVPVSSGNDSKPVGSEKESPLPAPSGEPGSGLLVSPDGQVLSGGVGSMVDYLVDKAPVAVAASKSEVSSAQTSQSAVPSAVESGRELLAALGAPSVDKAPVQTVGSSGSGELLPPVVAPDPLPLLGGHPYVGYQPPPPGAGIGPSDVLPSASSLAVGQLW